MTTVSARLTQEADRRYTVVKVPGIPSSSELRRLLLLCRQNDEIEPDAPGVCTHADLNLRELLRGRILDSFIQQDRLRRLQRHGALTVFVFHGSAAAASKIAKVPERRLSDWAAEFLEYAADWLTQKEDERVHRERMRSEDWQRRLLQCQHICGRKSFKGGGSLLSDWTGCQQCPLNLALP